MYFTDQQYEALEAKAAQAGITFAEALRRALDEWMAPGKGQSMQDVSSSSAATRTTVYVKLHGRDEEPLIWRNAHVLEDEFNGYIEVIRSHTGKRVGRFAEGDISTWYVEGSED